MRAIELKDRLECFPIIAAIREILDLPDENEEALAN